MILITILISSAIASALIVAQILLFLSNRKRSVDERLNQMCGGGRVDIEKEGSFLLPEEKTVSQSKKNGASETQAKPAKLYLAGYHTPKELRNFMFLKLAVTSLLCGSFLTIVGTEKVAEYPYMFFVLMLLVLIGWRVIPGLVLTVRIKSRQEEVSVHLADTLDLLIICLEAGLGFDAALLKVAHAQYRTSKVLSEELLYTNHEIIAGKRRADALRSLALRCGNQVNIRSLVAIIIQAERFGSSIAHVLRIQADMLRFKRTQNLREAITKVPVKMLFPMIFFILPSLFVILLGPAVLCLFNMLGTMGS